MAIAKASDDEIGVFLTGHPGWQRVEDQLQREFRFADFSEAFAFMTRVALVAERDNHHPDWCNIYNRVDVRLSTHEAGGITLRDFVLAESMDELAG